MHNIGAICGANNIVKTIRDMGITNEWVCFDISPSPNNVTPDISISQRDTIKNFPQGFSAIITNPPYLGKSSASRMHLPYPDTEYDDLYKHCLKIMLDNCDYVAAIIPESFITANLFIERLYGVISINFRIFDETDCPVCLALFTPKPSPRIYLGQDYLGTFNEFKQYDLSEFSEDVFPWKFNDPIGNIGVKCVDNQQGDDIYFHYGEDIKSEDIKVSSRSFTRLSGLPNAINRDKFIETCNKVLNEYRKNTKDVFLTSFKSLRKDGKYRRRIDFKTLRYIMNKGHPNKDTLSLFNIYMLYLFIHLFYNSGNLN